MIGKLIDEVDKNHKRYSIVLGIGVVLLLTVGIMNIPSYEDYCKEPQAQCKR